MAADRAAARAEYSPPLTGALAAPGDKSISHRALIFAALAEGESVASGLLDGDDVLRTAAAMRALGARVEREGRGGAARWRITGSQWSAPDVALYFGNSGTGARLVLGAAAGQGVAARFDGDASLRRRPMARVLAPLRAMGLGARDAGGRLPVELRAGAPLRAIDYAMPTASAQVKSAILLAGLGATGETIVRESAPTRDHTERLLAAFGAQVCVAAAEGGCLVRLIGPQRLKAAALDIPGDPSSAAFLVAAALIVPGSDVLVKNVCVNPTRTGFYETLNEMGADISFENRREAAGEPVADIRARASALKGVAVPAARAAAMIDEYPVLAVLSAYADGATEMTGVAELRVKESDRIAAVAAGLKANGVRSESGGDWLRVSGAGAEGVPGGGRVATLMDHRIAMSFLVMGLAAKSAVEIDDAAMIATSYPGFFEDLRALGARL
jgi:3-phosphoshikimate 1-carboxyvinyltransferase